MSTGSRSRDTRSSTERRSTSWLQPSVSRVKSPSSVRVRILDGTGVSAALPADNAALVVVVVGAVAVAALLWWPRVGLARDARALARVSLPGLAGRLSGMVVRDPAGNIVPAQIRDGRIWPAVSLSPGEPLTIRVTVRRPGWAGWLV